MKISNLKKWMQQNKIWLAIYGALIVLTLFFAILKLNQVSFFCISTCINVFLVHILVETTKLLKLKWTKKEIIMMVIATVFIYGFYLISLLTRNFIYYWDYSCYYNIQIETIERFNESLFSGIRSLVGSTWGGEYGNFLSFITQLPFAFTSKTPNSYVGSCIFLFAPYMIYSLSILIKKLLEILKEKNKELIMGVTLLTFILFPLLYATSIYGQPDLFGLFFIFLIIVLTYNYDFKKLDVERLVLIFFTTYMLFISRRWYVYWILSYYICYAIPILYSCIKDEKNRGKILKHLFGYAAICGVLFLGTLFPLLKNIILNDYSSHYAFYQDGGLFKEIEYQVGHIGLAMTIIMGLGLFLGIVEKKYRKITITSILQIFMIIFLFTRIQTMGYHHSLTLLPSYLALVFIFISFLNEGKKRYFIYACLGILMVINFTTSLMGLKTKFTSDAKISVPYQEDYEEIGKVVDWLETNLDDQNNAYMISHNDNYNPDKFRNYHKPNRYIEYHLPYGSAIVGVHKFPTELFTATYVITTTPFEKISVEEKYEQVFEKLVKEGKFELEETFNMNNGYVILIYKRVKDVDVEEIEKYEEALKEESKSFPELYKDILEDYKKNL